RSPGPAPAGSRRGPRTRGWRLPDRHLPAHPRRRSGPDARAPDRGPLSEGWDHLHDGQRARGPARGAGRPAHLAGAAEAPGRGRDGRGLGEGCIGPGADPDSRDPREVGPAPPAETAEEIAITPCGKNDADFRPSEPALRPASVLSG